MALDHVDERARLVVVTRAIFESQLLVVDDVDLLDVLRAPQRLENAIGEPQAQQVEDRRLAEKVIDLVDLVFRHQPGQLVVERDSAASIGAERLL